MSGGRFLLLGGPLADPDRVVSQLSESGRSCQVVSPETLLSVLDASCPDVVIMPLAGVPGPEPLPQVLTALTERPVHLLALADAGFAPPVTGIRPLRDLGADALGALLDALDGQRSWARQARGAEAWRQAFLTGFPGMVAVCDGRYGLEYANTPVRLRAGGEVAGKTCHMALHGRSEPCPWCPRDTVLQGQNVFMEIQSPLDGRFFAMAATPLLPPGEPPRMLTLCIDVTERNMAVGRLKSLNRDMERRVAERTDALARQTEVLAEANQRFMELDALKSGFLATVTHDLRTPLTSVLGFAKLTRREFIKEFMPFSEVSDALRRKGARIADNLRIIENEGARLTRLVNDFLDLSKIESGRLDWNDREIDPVAVVRSAVQAVGGEYEQHEGLALVVSTPQPLPPLFMDPDRLMQVLVNLLTNAARHTGEGEVTLTAGRVDRHRLEFRVSDTGAGIPEDERERIFDKFYQVRRGDTASSERRGTGLGLTICKQIVERYGGSIRVEAGSPRGTVFVVELPCLHHRVSGIPGEAGDAPRTGPAPS